MAGSEPWLIPRELHLYYPLQFRQHLAVAQLHHLCLERSYDRQPRRDLAEVRRHRVTDDLPAEVIRPFGERALRPPDLVRLRVEKDRPADVRLLDGLVRREVDPPHRQAVAPHKPAVLEAVCLRE